MRLFLFHPSAPSLLRCSSRTLRSRVRARTRRTREIIAQGGVHHISLRNRSSRLREDAKPRRVDVSTSSRCPWPSLCSSNVPNSKREELYEQVSLLVRLNFLVFILVVPGVLSQSGIWGKNSIFALNIVRTLFIVLDSLHSHKNFLYSNIKAHFSIDLELS